MGRAVSAISPSGRPEDAQPRQVPRSVYDKVPPPPPNHFRGADKITIHEDTDGDGIFDKHKTFLDGLNIATSFASGRGGVWVLNPPYLLFYPDTNSDDVPDGDPVRPPRRLRPGRHALASPTASAGAPTAGSTPPKAAPSPATSSGPATKPPVHSMGQLIWRYHPETHRYEIFAEGGGNAFGVEIDAKGRVFSGHNGGDTPRLPLRPGRLSTKRLRQARRRCRTPSPSATSRRWPAPYAQRFTHTFVIYDGGALPEQYNGQLFGVDPLAATSS